MTRRELLLVAAVAGAGVLLVSLVAWRRVAGVQAEAAQVLRQAQQVQFDLWTVHSARARRDALAAGRRPDADLVTRAQQTLVAAGLPISAFIGVQPRQDQSRPGNGLRLQSVLLRLGDLRPSDLGAWLGAWQAQGSPWQVAELQLTHRRSAGPGPAALQDGDRFDAAVLLAAPYWQEGP